MGRIQENLRGSCVKMNSFQRQHFESFENGIGFEDFIDACLFTEVWTWLQD